MTVDEWLTIPVVLGGLAALVGGFLLLRSLAEPGVRARLREAPRLRLREGIDKGTATFEGRALPLRDYVLTAPISNRPAVFFRAHAYRSRGKNDWVCIASSEHTEAWLIQDADGTKAIVDSTKARVIGVSSEGISAVFAEPTMHVAPPTDLQGIHVRARVPMPSANRYAEESIGVGETVTVSGVLVMRADGWLEIDRPAGGWLLALVGTADAFLGISARRRRIGVRLLVPGLVVAAVIGAGLVLWKEHRIARGRARLDAEAKVLRQQIESRLEIVAGIEADAATRPLVLRTAIDPRGVGTEMAVQFPAMFEFPGVHRGSAAPKCRALRSDTLEQASNFDLRQCLRDDVLVIVRERPDAKGLRFGGDALVYDLADGRYVGGVLLDIAHEPADVPVWYQVEALVGAAVEGFEKP